VRRRQVDQDLDEELRGYLEAAIERGQATGLTREQATRRARVEMGSVAAVKDQVRAVGWEARVESVWQDVRYATRTLRRAPGFTIVAVLTLALGIGANTAVFSVVRAVLLRPLSYMQPEELVAISYPSPDSRQARQGVPSVALDGWIGRARSFSGFATYVIGQAIWLTPDGEPVRMSAARVSHTLLPLLGAGVALGRTIQAADVAPGAPDVMLLSHAFWRQRFASDPGVIGRHLTVDRGDYTVVGVTDSAFRFPSSTTPDVLLPFRPPRAPGLVMFLDVVGRLNPNVSPRRAEAELRDIDRANGETLPPIVRSMIAAGARPAVEPLQRHMAGDARRTLILSMGAVVLVLLLACANIAGLLMARTSGRERELAMRAALGATPLRLAQWLLAECVVLAAIAAAVAILALAWSVGGLRMLLAGSVPHPEAIAIDPMVVLFSLAVAGGTTLLAACAPMMRIVRRDAIAGLRLASAGRARPVVRELVRVLLVVGQVATAVTLLVGSLLLVNSLWRLGGAALGFAPDHVLSLKIPASSMARDEPRRAAQVHEIVQRLRAIPGVVSVGASTALPLAGHSVGFTIPIAGEPAPAADGLDATPVDLVSPGYFRTMGVRVGAGRDFEAHDTAAAPPVAIVNGTFARLHFGTRDPLGRRLGLGGTPRDATIAIVGIVDDVKDGNPGDAARPIVYRPFMQGAPQVGWSTAMIAVRSSTDPRTLPEVVRQALVAAVPGASPYDVTTMEARVSMVVAPQRQRAVVFALFAALAVALAAIGLYGLLASAVMQDMHAFGVRLALGARRSGLVRLVFLRAAIPTAVGVVIGLGGAAALTRVLADLLYGVTPFDPATYLAAAATMLIVALAAGLVPAIRAMGADPLRILRAE
jgi:putative ABC transport system permease protein